MSETAAMLVAINRICDELETISSALRSLVDLMQAHKTVSDSEETDRPPQQDFSSHNNDDRKTPDNIQKSE